MVSVALLGGLLGGFLGHLTPAKRELGSCSLPVPHRRSEDCQETPRLQELRILWRVGERLRKEERSPTPAVEHRRPLGSLQAAAAVPLLCAGQRCVWLYLPRGPAVARQGHSCFPRAVLWLPPASLRSWPAPVRPGSRVPL